MRDERGMTLTELLFAMALAVIIFGAAVTTFVEFLDVSTRSDSQTQAQDTARSTTDRLASQLRNAMSTGASGSKPIEVFSDYDLIFLAPLPGATIGTNNPRGLYHVRYCLGTTSGKDNLWYQTQAYNAATQQTQPSTAKCPDNAWTTKTLVADNVVNRTVKGVPIFTRVVDSNGDTTYVLINAWVDWNVNKDPAATQLTTKVNLRNVNRFPTAAMSCTGLANGHAQCDASASFDPDGQTLTYAWSLDGSTLSNQTSYRLDYSPLTSKSNHTIVLTVTDPGGATASISKPVSIP